MNWGQSERTTGRPACPTCGRRMTERFDLAKYTCSGAVGFGGRHEPVELTKMDLIERGKGVRTASTRSPLSDGLS